MHTKDMLAEELEKAGLTEMATKARGGYYHDFLSPLPDPAVTLANDLAQAGSPAALAIRSRHMNGDFDATLEESEEWASSPEGQEAQRKLMNKE